MCQASPRVFVWAFDARLRPPAEPFLGAGLAGFLVRDAIFAMFYGGLVEKATRDDAHTEPALLL
jgi:hypothetical protein